MKKQKAALYIRVSNSVQLDKDEASLESQMKLLIEAHGRRVRSESIKRGIANKKLVQGGGERE